MSTPEHAQQPRTAVVPGTPAPAPRADAAAPAPRADAAAPAPRADAPAPAPRADAATPVAPGPRLAPTPAPRLADLTTLRVGGPVARLVEAASEEQLIDAVRSADAAGVPVLVLGGGSNLLAGDAPFDGVVVRDARSRIDRGPGVRPDLAPDRAAGAPDRAPGGPVGQPDARPDRAPDRTPGAPVGRPGARVRVTATAGTTWDELVVTSLGWGLSGLEALSGVPGTVGAAPVQNVGAYGQEVSATLVGVRAWDRGRSALVEIPASDLRLGYRTSLLKESLHGGDPDGGTWGPTGRWVVLAATFALERSELSAPVLYTELARRVGVEVGGRAPSSDVRRAVLELRRSKGMVLDPGDHDTWSAGSFFTNPILPAATAGRLPAGAPRFPVGEGLVKTSAAWLISHAGFTRGWALPSGPAGASRPGHEGGSAAPAGPVASLSTKHVLALTNRGGATAADIVALARAVRDGVRDAFGIELVPEPVTVGVSL